MASSPASAPPSSRRHRPNETARPPAKPPPSASIPTLMAKDRTAAESRCPISRARSRGFRRAAKSDAVVLPEIPVIVTRNAIGAVCVAASARARPITGARTAISVLPDTAGHARSSARNGAMSYTPCPPMATAPAAPPIPAINVTSIHHLAGLRRTTGCSDGCSKGRATYSSPSGGALPNSI